MHIYLTLQLDFCFYLSSSVFTAHVPNELNFEVSHGTKVCP